MHPRSDSRSPGPTTGTCTCATVRRWPPSSAPPPASSARAIVMPNLKPPVTTVAAAAAYRDRILGGAAGGARVRAADDALPHRQHVRRARSRAPRRRASCTPSSTTRPARRPTPTPGVTAIERAYPALAAMEQHGVVLSLHGEVTDPDVDIFDRERVFVDTLLGPDRARLPGAPHRARAHHDARGGGVRRAQRRPNVAATITPQHLLYSRNAMFVGGVRPHLYCLPILKRETHRAGAGRRRDVGQPEVLPRHRQRAARAAHEGERLRLRRLLLAHPPRSSSTPKRSRTPARSTGWRDSRASSAPTSTACRATPTRSRWSREPWTCRRRLPFGERRRHRAAARRREPCAGACV